MKKLVQFIFFIVGLNLAVIFSPLLIIIIPLYLLFKGDTNDKKEKNVSERWGTYEEYLSSDVWQEKRKAVMERADGSCESDGCNNSATEVHHDTYRHDLGEEPISSLRALCRPCHSEEHPEKPKGYMTAEEAERALDRLTRE